MADRDFILAPQTVGVSVALEPAHNVLNTLLLICNPEAQSGLNKWVVQTAASLSPEQKHTNTLLYSGLFDALEPNRSWDSFPAYLDNLVAAEPVALRDRAIEWMEHKPGSPGRESLLKDLQTYLAFIEDVFTKKSADKMVFDESIHAEIHRLLNDPPALKNLLVPHVQELWDQVLAKEWERVRPMLQESVDAFQELNLSGMTALEAVRVVTKRDMSGYWDEYLAPFKHLIFVPSAHIGPYVTSIADESTAWIIFGARLPEGTRAVSPALSRSELLVQLNALADDIRLRILELLTEHDELCAQDIITILDLSQSSASRHLRQLTATGYLTERRREVSKCYSLNLERIDSTVQSLKNFLRKK